MNTTPDEAVNLEAAVERLEKRQKHLAYQGALAKHHTGQTADQALARSLCEASAQEAADLRAVLSALSASADERIKERAAGQEIINERDKWIVELIRERDASNARALAAEETQAWLRDRADAMAKYALTHKPDSKARAFVQGRVAGLEDALAFLSRTTLASMGDKNDD